MQTLATHLKAQARGTGRRQPRSYARTTSRSRRWLTIEGAQTRVASRGCDVWGYLNMEGEKGAPEMAGAGRELGATCRSVLVRDNPRVRPATQIPLDGHRGSDAAALQGSA
jgi:hypothetical protein